MTAHLDQTVWLFQSIGLWVLNNLPIRFCSLKLPYVNTQTLDWLFLEVSRRQKDKQWTAQTPWHLAVRCALVRAWHLPNPPPSEPDLAGAPRRQTCHHSLIWDLSNWAPDATPDPCARDTLICTLAPHTLQQSLSLQQKPSMAFQKTVRSNYSFLDNLILFANCTLKFFIVALDSCQEMHRKLKGHWKKRKI